MSASDDMIENENEMLRDRVADLEKRVHDQNDEITCLRATLADCLRRINTLEVSKSHVQVRVYKIYIIVLQDTCVKGCSPLKASKGTLLMGPSTFKLNPLPNLKL